MSGPGPTPRIAVVVLTWNQRDVTLECLESLTRQRYPHAELIVVDNCSLDGTPAAVRAAYPAVTVIEMGDNLGFVGGNNAGLEHALRGDADYIMLLNNDTVVAEDMLEILVDVMEADPTIGISGPKMYYFDQPDIIWSAGNRVNWRTGESLRLQAEELDQAGSQLREVDYITGCGICLRREVIEQIGLLDSRFFIYYEETDWCNRALRSGWRTVYVPDAKLWHKVSAAMGTTSPATDYYMTRNALLFLAKNLHGPRRVWALSWTVARTLKISAAYSVKNRSAQRLRSRTIRLLALRDAALGRWGKMGRDIERRCYPQAAR